jgi:TolB-like protein/Flp pilus assembly protein TadD
MVPGSGAKSGQSAGDRLDSWKEIAAYLRRDESTVRRWEKDGLPVHRHRHKFRAAIFAYKSELDIWWNNSEHQASTVPLGEAAHSQSAAALDVPFVAPAQTVVGPSSFGRHFKWMLVVSALVLLVASGYWGWQRFVRDDRPQRSVMLAVLPLENLSGNPDEDYFADGLTEEMLTQLGRLQPDRLGVIARTSIMQYKGTKKPVAEIGRELHVNYLLEGSVRREAGQVRISVQLIRVSDQTHLWAESYQRDARDILALQNEVANSVAREISLKLSAQGQAALAHARPLNPKTHELHLRGRYLWNLRTEDGLQKSIEYFQQAIAQDPGYAPSYAALADAYIAAGNWGSLPPVEAYPKAKAAAARALEIDERMAEARVALAYATHLFDWDPVVAEKEFKRALELDPNYAPGHQWYAVFLASRGRFDEAIAHITRAQELDPVSLIIGDVRGWIYSLARRNQQAIEEFRKTIELDPKFYPTHYDLGMTYADTGSYEAAIRELGTARTLSGDSERTISGLAYAYAMAGEKAQARQLLAELSKHSSRRYVPSFDIAVVHGALGENDQAFAWLEKAFAERHPWLVMLRVAPKVDKLRSDPRFEVLLRRVRAAQ